MRTRFYHVDVKETKLTVSMLHTALPAHQLHLKDSFSNTSFASLGKITVSSLEASFLVKQDCLV